MSNFRQTWGEFLRAIQSPEPFNAWSWTARLALALGREIQHELRVLRPLVPLFGMSLVGLVNVAFVLSLRNVIYERWCIDQSQCYSIYIHDLIVVYLSIMILYNYTMACFTSPGVALPKARPTEWSAKLGQGGFLGCNPKFDVEAEKKRLALYGSIGKGKESQKRESSSIDIPSNQASFCEKCQIDRPPRCHHCSVCDRCVLQFDHHCIWLCQCVGYNNYRHFLLVLVYIMLGCWYGVAVLFYPFYEPLRAQVREQGWKWFYSNGTGFLDLPQPYELLRLLVTLQGWPAKVVIDIVYPFLLGLGAVMGVFLGTHLKYILTARTTLENKMLATQRYNDVLDGKRKPVSNPFDQGYVLNLKQIFGTSILPLILPISPKPPSPFVPKTE